MRRKNSFGLVDYIPEDVKRAVRKKCGFGCIVCGSAFYHYDHFDPPFSDAKTHDADGIYLLCGSCHDRKNKGLLSNETIKRYLSKPTCLQSGFSFGPLDIGPGTPTIKIGSVTAKNCRTLIKMNGKSLLALREPREPGQPLLLSAHSTSPQGRELFRIEENQIIIPSNSLDAKVQGARIEVRDDQNKLAIRLRIEQSLTIIFEALSLCCDNSWIILREGRPTKLINYRKQTIEIADLVFENSDTAIDLNDNGIILGQRGYMSIGSLARTSEILRRNSKCPCGSQDRYKHCHGKYYRVN